MSPAQRERILSLLSRIDEHLLAVVQLLDPDTGVSPLTGAIADATPMQHAVIADHILLLRRTTADYAVQNGLDVSGFRAAATRMAYERLLECEQYAAELSPAVLRGDAGLDTAVDDVVGSGHCLTSTSLLSWSMRRAA